MALKELQFCEGQYDSLQSTNEILSPAVSLLTIEIATVGLASA
jgi:hypothetical protein